MKLISRLFIISTFILPPLHANVHPALVVLTYFGGGHLANVGARGIGRTFDEWLGRSLDVFNTQPAKAVAVIDGKHAGNEAIRLILSKYIASMADTKNPAFAPYEAGMSYLSAQELFYFIHDLIKQAPDAFKVMADHESSRASETTISPAAAGLLLDLVINFFVGWAISYSCKKAGDHIAAEKIAPLYEPAKSFPLKNIISTSIGAPVAYGIKRLLWDPYLAPLLKLRPTEGEHDHAPGDFVSTGFKAGDKMTFAGPALLKLWPLLKAHPLFAAFMAAAVPASVAYYNAQEGEEKPTQK